MRTAQTKAQSLRSTWKWKCKKCCTHGFSSLLLHDGSRKMMCGARSKRTLQTTRLRPFIFYYHFCVLRFLLFWIYISTLPTCINSDLADLDLSWWMSARNYDRTCMPDAPSALLHFSFGWCVRLPKRCNLVAETQFSFQLLRCTFYSVNRVFLFLYVNCMLGRHRRFRKNVNKSTGRDSWMRRMPIQK